ncbi:6465_t:CDS:2, partial [Entrophospora sp. SA101]
MEDVKCRIVRKYHLHLNSHWFTIPLAKAILGFPVHKDDVVDPNESSMTYQELSSMGVVNLVPIKRTEEYLIQLPYVWVCAIVEDSKDPGMMYWKSMLKYDEPMYWQNFEDFNVKFWALCLSLFCLMGYEKINLKTLCKGADFSLSFPDVEVDLPQEDIKLYKLLHQYPVTKTYENNQAKYVDIMEVRNGYINLDLFKNDNIRSYIGCVFLNVSGAPFDAFGFLNKSSEPAGEICIAQQSKSTTTSNVVINQGLFNNVYEKVTKAMNVEKKDWALLFLTNADKKNLSIDDKPNSALVSVENFQKFYGYTYTSRAQFAS